MKTLILNGLEWMAENLSGYGGTEVGENTYYTWEQAKKAVEKIGKGWRLPTQDEFKALCNLYNTWDDECKGRFFGKNKELFLPALGHLVNDKIAYDIDPEGHYLCGSFPMENFAPCMCFDFAETWGDYDYKEIGYSVRLVRD